jgi:outer membrane protein TolC
MNRLLLVVLLSLAGAVARGETNTVLSLTLRDCIERALTHNLDIRIERINPGIAQWGVVREQGAFDPTLTGRANYEDATTPLGPERAASLGLNALDEQQLQASAGLTGKLPFGLQYDLTAFDSRASGTLATNFVYTGAAAITLTQPLLKNFGFGSNTAQIRAARQNRAMADEQFAAQVMDTITAVHRAYYELVFALEDHKAKLEDLNRAKALLDQNRKRVQVGVLSPLDVTQAEAGVAEREEAVIVAERVIHDNESALRQLIAPDALELRGTSLVPVDYPVVEMIETDAARSIATALEQRPDFRQAKHELERRNILVAYNRNQLWPQIDLQGSYGLNGRSGTGFGDFVDDTASGDSPVWSLGVIVTLPLGNREARANFRAAKLEAEQALLSLKRLEQQIVIEVDNAVRLVESNLKRVEATRVASRLAEESLKAEEERLRAGTSTSFLVLQAQAQLASARSAEIRARADYSQSLAALARAEGSTPRQRNITLDERL